MPIWDSKLRTRAGLVQVSDSGGRGAPIVMLHGSGASQAVFARQFASPLAGLHRLVALDLPGHGASEDAAWPERDYTITGLAEVVHEVIEARGLHRPVVLGWSLGGNIAIELLRLWPERLAGVMLSGAPPASPGPLGMLRAFQAKPDLLLATKSEWNEREALRFYELCFHGAGEPAFLKAIRRADGRLRPVVARSLMSGEAGQQKRMVERTKTPIAVVNGENEPIARLSYFGQLDYQALWGNSCRVIAGAGHAPFWDAPDVFNRLLMQFAADVADVGSRRVVAA